MKRITLLFLLFFTQIIFAQTSYPPQAGVAGTTAIHKDSTAYVAWATGITVERGYMNIANPSLGVVSVGNPNDALGAPTGPIVSLGDKGTAVLTFTKPIYDGPGFDFAVFENGGTSFLELAVVEVSSDGINFFGFPTHSLTQTATQVGSFGTPLAENLNNIAGKYAGTYGTPFDLSEITANPLLDKQNITHVKVIDVVGTIDPQYGTLDSFGNLINDSYPTPFNSGGFDLQAVGVINEKVASSNPSHNTIQANVYPNPASDILNIQTAESITNVTAYNISGQKVLQANTQTLNVSALKAGVYILKVETLKGSATLKFVKK